MDKLISLELAIKALTGWETDPTDEEIEYTLRKLATDKNVGTTIIRQQAIDAVTDELDMIDHVPQWVFDRLEKRLKQLPPAQPEPCEDAVSRKAVKDGFVEMCSLICPYTEKQRHVMCGSCLLGTAFDVLEATQSVTPKKRTGKWILDRSGAYCCSECMEPCAGYVMMKPRDKFCKMCGAKMEGVSE